MGSPTKKRPSIVLGLFIIFVIIFLNALGPYLQLQQIATLGLVPALAFIAFFYDMADFGKGKKEFVLLAIILVLSLITIFDYIGFEEFLRNFYLLLGAVLSAYIVIGLTKDTDFTTYFHIGYILTIILLFAIMIFEGNISLSFATAIDYRDRFLLNANAYSYYCVFANFSLFYLYLNYRNKLILVLLAILPIIFLVLAFTTQSRAGLVLIILINVLFWVFVNKSYNLSGFKKLARTFLLIAAFIFLSIKFLQVYEGSRISSRVNVTSQREDSRQVLFWEGIEVFMDNPIFGAGLGQFPFYSQYKLFTHNSYTEILAEQGIIGAIFLFILYFTPAIKSFKNFRLDPKDPILRCNLLFFVVFLLYNNAYVFYKFPFSMMYFFLIVSIQRNTNINKNSTSTIE